MKLTRSASLFRRRAPRRATSAFLSARRLRASLGPQALAVVCLLAIVGCRQDMHNQPKYRPLRAAAFFRDGSSARPPVEGTIARGTLQEDEAFFTGKVGGAPIAEMPFAVD